MAPPGGPGPSGCHQDRDQAEHWHPRVTGMIVTVCGPGSVTSLFPASLSDWEAREQ